MDYQRQIEIYLIEVDQALSPLSFADRAEVIAGLGAQLKAKTDQDPLLVLGAPLDVANRIRKERGLPPFTPEKKSSALRVVLISLAVMFALFAASASLLVWKLTPLFKVDETSGRVTLLGGLIDLDGKAGKLKVGSSEFKADAPGNRSFEGSKPIKDAKASSLEVRLIAGRVAFVNAEKSQLIWKCQLPAVGPLPEVTDTGGAQMRVDFSKSGGASCEMQIPVGMKVSLKGLNGNVFLDHPRYPADIQLSNGLAHVVLDPAMKYNFSSQVQNGKNAALPVSQDADALQMSITVTNGMISAGS